MKERFNAQKEIEDLSIMTNNGFNAMFDLYKKASANIEVLQEDVVIMKVDISDMKDDIVELKTDVHELKQDVFELKTDVSELKKDMSVLKTDVVDLKEDMTGVKTNLRTVNHKLDFIIEHMVTRHEFEASGQ